MTERAVFVSPAISLQADECNERLHLLDHVGDAVLQLDADDRVVYANRRARSVLAAAPDGRALWLADLFGQSETGVLEALCRTARATGQEAAGELGDATAGTWTAARAVPWTEGGVALFLCDISKRRQSERALRASERRIGERTRSLEASCAALRRLRERSARVVRDLPLEVVLLEGVCGGVFRVEEANLAFCRSWGGAPERLRGLRLREVMPPHIAVALERNLARCVTEGARIEFEGVVAPARAGLMDEAGTGAAGPRVMHVIMVPLTAEPVPDGFNGPAVHHVLLTALDLTDIRRAETQLLKAQRMEAIGQLTGGMAHDFNNLLTVILGSLELLERRLETERDRRYLRIAIAAAQRGGTLTQQLLAYARRQYLAPVPIDLNAALVGMTDMLRLTVGDAVTLQPDLAAELWPATADPVQLELVLRGLALNAREAMPQGGRLKVRTSNLGPADGLPADLAAGDYVCIALQDNGCGMSPTVLARATEPFFTTKGVGQGSGLGLAQAFGYAKQLGGTVRLFSMEGVGTTIELLLPRASGAATEPALAARRPCGAPDTDALKQCDLNAGSLQMAWLD
jgi:signal transduction histidine kinase